MISFFFFVWIFRYFSLDKYHQRWNHKKFHLQQRWDVAYRKSARSLKSVQELWQFFSLFSWIFLAILTNPNRPKASLVGLRMASTSSCKNFNLQQTMHLEMHFHQNNTHSINNHYFSPSLTHTGFCIWGERMSKFAYPLSSDAFCLSWMRDVLERYA